MSIVNSVKGFVRKVSGIPPLTLLSCVDNKSLIDYTIEGASGGVGDVTDDGKYQVPIVCSDGTTTNIYLDAPLEGVGDYADAINFKDQKAIQRIGVKVFNGSEDWTPSSTLNNRYMSPQITDVMVDDKINNNAYYLSNNYFTPISWSDRGNYTENDNYCYIYVSAANKQIVVGSPNTKTLADFKAWLADMYSVGTPFTVCYPLQEIKVKEDNLPMLPTVQGTTIYTVETAVQPSNMIVTYYATAKE